MNSNIYWGQTNTNNYNNGYQFSAIRYYTYEAGTKAAVFRGGASAGFIIDPATPASAAGTRVQQAQLYIGGVLRRFNFGFAAESAVTDQSVIELNLTGAGVKKYRVQKGYGPANPGITVSGSNASGLDTTSNSCILLPWNAP